MAPTVKHPPLNEQAVPSPSGDWSASWSRDASSYEYKITLHASLRAKFAPLPWQGGLGDVSFLGEPIGFAVGLPILGLAYALRYLPRALSPRLHIDRKRVRFGLRTVSLDDLGAFVVETTGASSDLVTAVDGMPLLSCGRREALRRLRNELNEALFVVKYGRPPIAVKAGRMPYRG